MSSRALVMLLLSVGNIVRKVQYRENAECLHASFMENALPSDLPALNEFRQADGRTCALCHSSEAGKPCWHLRQAWELECRAGRPPQALLIALLQNLYTYSGDCPASRELSRQCLAWLCAQIDSRLENFRYTSDATKVLDSGCRAPSKRRRIDEDFRLTVVADVARQGRAANAVGFLRAVDKCSPKNAQPWSEQFLLEYEAAGWLAGARSSTVCCCFDASRIGNPAENTEIFGAQLFGPSSMDCFMWGPPQAIASGIQYPFPP